MEKDFIDWPITKPPSPKFLNQVPGILPKYSGFANLELNNIIIQDAIDDEVDDNDGEDELIDLGLD